MEKTNKKLKPKILLIPDMPGWAFDNRAKEIAKHLSKYYDIDKKCADDIKKNPQIVDYNKYDCIFIFFWQHRFWLKVDAPKEKLMTGIFSYSSWRKKKRIIKTELKEYKAVIVSNRQVENYFRNKAYKVFYAPPGVNEKKFYPKRTKKTSNKLIIGWAGNPDHCGRNYKGYWNILVPLVKKNSDWLELKSAIKDDLPHHKMNDFYNSVNVLVCVSKGEMYLNTVLEASACGKAVISTRVGIAEELIKNNHNGILIGRNKDSLLKALKKLKNNPSLMKKMGQNARKEIEKNWTYEKNFLAHKKAFDYIIYGK